MLSNAFSFYQFDLTPLKTEESLTNNEICSNTMCSLFLGLPQMLNILIESCIKEDPVPGFHDKHHPMGILRFFYCQCL